MSIKTRSPWWFFLAGGLTAVVLFALGAFSAWLYFQFGQAQFPAITRSAQEDMPLFAEAWHVIEDDFIGELPDPTVRTYGAIRGSIETLNDPYTYFVEPEPAVREQEQLQGHFGGIGAYLTLNEAGQVVLDPMIERPAAKAGVLKGDVLLAIDGAPPPLSDLDAVTDLIRGPVGTTVRLTVLRNGETLDIEVERAQIELPSVAWRPIDGEPGIGYIRIERFSGLTETELVQALQELRAQGANDALILDLRDDPGGLLDAAVAVSDHFLDGGAVLIERHADGSEQTYEATSGNDAPTQKVAILVNGGTASAAEIVAGALHDRAGSVLIGETTYGKGSIQRIHRLSDNSAVHVTFARWFTPNGYPIDGQGLTPDIPVDPASATADVDPFLQTAIETLRARLSAK